MQYPQGQKEPLAAWSMTAPGSMFLTNVVGKEIRFMLN
jgi:hypothetical protein